MSLRITETRVLAYTDLLTGKKRSIGQVVGFDEGEKVVLVVGGKTGTGELPGTDDLQDNLAFANVIARKNSGVVRTVVNLDLLEKYRQEKGIEENFDLVNLYSIALK